jgi:hypothetical protein
MDIYWIRHLTRQKLEYLDIPFKCSLYKQTGHLQKSYTGAIEDEMYEDSMLELATNLDSLDLNKQINLRDYPEDGFSPDLDSIIGKLKIIFPTLFSSIYSWEKDSLNNSSLLTKRSYTLPWGDAPCEPSETPHLHQSPYPSLHLATTTQALPPISLL